METKNYKLFKFIKSNRPVRRAMVLSLIESIQEIGYDKSKPITVTPNHEIIDGQHRFEACKELNLPIIYEVSRANIQKAMVLLNKNQQVWRLNEYIKSWAAKGKKCYKVLEAFEDQYKLGVSNAIIICRGASSRKTNDIRFGKEFEILKTKDTVAEFILGCKPYLHFYKSTSFVQAVQNMFSRTSAENCVKVLQRIQSIKQQPTVNDYLTVFENIINRYRRVNADVISLKSC